MKVDTQRPDVPVTQAALEVAVRAGEARAKDALRAAGVSYLPDMGLLLVKLQDGTSVGLPVQNYPEFADLTPEQLAQVSLGFGGSALCLEEADLHVSLAGLFTASACLMEMLASIAARAPDTSARGFFAG